MNEGRGYGTARIINVCIFIEIPNNPRVNRKPILANNLDTSIEPSEKSLN